MALPPPVVPEAFRREFPYLDDVMADHRLLGYPAVLNPMPQCVSSSRMDMFASHRSQALVIHGAEFPDLFSGYEKEDGKYTFNSTRRDQDIEVLMVIPRYSATSRVKGSDTPALTVIYKGIDDNKVGYFDVDKYFLGSDGFGFTYDWKTAAFLEPGRFVPKEEVIACSPNLKGSQYCAGTNLETAFLSTPYCVEDAMWISTYAAEKMASDELRRVIINIPQDVRPLYLYDNGKSIFPDIGKKVRDDGILCAFRNVSTTTFTADTAPDQMEKVNSLTDDVVVVNSGSEVVNMEFIMNRTRYNPAYEQAEAYHKATLDYYRKIWDFYQQHVRKEFQITPTFNVLISKVIKTLVGNGVRIQGYSDSIKGRTEFEGMDRQPVEYIQAIITYKRIRRVQPGTKISDDAGAKGVISKISPVEDMPRDAFGNVAHVVMDGCSVTSRTNPEQFWKTGINWMSSFITRRVAELVKEGRHDDAFAMIVDYVADIRPNSAEMVKKVYDNPAGRKKYTTWVAENFLKIHMPCYYKGFTMEKALATRAKWQIPESPATYVMRDENGIGIPVTTNDTVRIGRKYIFCLDKVPHLSSPGFARVSHQGYPIKAGSDAKLRYPIAINPIKTGEDELRFIIADVGPEEMTRYISLLGNSPQSGTAKLIYALMRAEKPTTLGRVPVTNRELLMGNTILGTFHHETSVLGIDTRRTRVTTYDAQFFQEAEGDDVLHMTGQDLSDLGEIGTMADFENDLSFGDLVDDKLPGKR